jgi:hypothetical protein
MRVEILVSHIENNRALSVHAKAERIKDLTQSFIVANRPVQPDEKPRLWASMTLVRCMSRPPSGVAATPETLKGKKILDPKARSGDLRVKFQATWEISASIR